MKDLVSIVTPTTKSREKCLDLQLKNIKNQNISKSICEWIIISADKNWNKESFNLCMSKLQEKTKIKIVYEFLEDEKNKDIENIGFLRNKLNSIVSQKSDYIFAFDDDDYYHSEYIQHSIKMMKKSGRLAAGCTSHVMYDTDLDQFYQFKGFSQFHTVNNCLSYHKDFLKTHNYNNEARNGEEKFFLKDFTSELVQLNPYKAVVQMVHSDNTYSKRKMIITNAIVDQSQRTLLEIDPVVSKKILNPYIDILTKEIEDDENDIVYYLGYGNLVWSPYETKLGGSEQAVLHLSSEWVKKGKKVLIVGDFKDDVILKANNDKKLANFMSFQQFSLRKKYKTVIFWRNLALNPMLKFIKAEKVFIDLHDRTAMPSIVEENINKIYKIFFKSDFHKNELKKMHPKIESKLEDKYVALENGVRVRKFNDKGKYKRIHNRFCYTSCYTRGLYQILAHLWPVIRGIDNTAELHVYYGMDLVNNEKFKEVMNYLLKQPGVFNHGRQSVDVIQKEKCMSTFHLYISDTKAETDCIAIRESAVSGCIPLLSTKGVFSERAGIHYEVDNTNDRNEMVQIALKIVSLMRDEKKVDEIRNSIKGNEKSWLQIAKKWLGYF